MHCGKGAIRRGAELQNHHQFHLRFRSVPLLFTGFHWSHSAGLWCCSAWPMPDTCWRWATRWQLNYYIPPPAGQMQQVWNTILNWMQLYALGLFFLLFCSLLSVGPHPHTLFHSLSLNPSLCLFLLSPERERERERALLYGLPFLWQPLCESAVCLFVCLFVHLCIW